MNVACFLPAMFGYYTESVFFDFDTFVAKLIISRHVAICETLMLSIVLERH